MKSVRASLGILSTLVVVASAPGCRSMAQSHDIPGSSYPEGRASWYSNEGHIRRTASAYVQFRSPVPIVTEPMLYPEFWVQNLPEKERGAVIASGEQIRDFNRKNARSAESIVDLREYQSRFRRAQLMEAIRKLSKPQAGPRFKDGQPVGAD